VRVRNLVCFPVETLPFTAQISTKLRNSEQRYEQISRTKFCQTVSYGEIHAVAEFLCERWNAPEFFLSHIFLTYLTSVLMKVTYFNFNFVTPSNTKSGYRFDEEEAAFNKLPQI